MDSAAAARIPCFKAYDVRGRVPGELDTGLAARIGAAYAAWLRPRRVALGYDVRPSSPALAQALAAALVEAGCEVVDIGRCGTEEVYFATFHLGLSGGIMVTASHNPPEYNGFKIVREEGRPVSADSGLDEIERLARAGAPATGGADPAAATARVRDRFEAEALRVDELDGVSMDFGAWRFNVRRSNTEPLVRLNVESRGDPALVAARAAEIRRLLLG